MDVLYNFTYYRIKWHASHNLQQIMGSDPAGRDDFFLMKDNYVCQRLHGF